MEQVTLKEFLSIIDLDSNIRIEQHIPSVFGKEEDKDIHLIYEGSLNQLSFVLVNGLLYTPVISASIREGGKVVILIQS